MKTIYVASRLANYAEVIEIQNELIRLGFGITFDWASQYKQVVESGREESEDEKVEIAERELQAVRDADALILVLPGGRGAHVELGAALGLNKLVFVLNEAGEKEIAFYMAGVDARVKIKQELYKAIKWMFLSSD